MSNPWNGLPLWRCAPSPKGGQRWWLGEPQPRRSGAACSAAAGGGLLRGLGWVRGYYGFSSCLRLMD